MATFEQRVSRAINRGKVYDADIAVYTKDAIRTLEDAHNWKHMWVEEAATLAAGARTRTIDNLKSCRWIKYLGADGNLAPLNKISPVQIQSILTEATAPSGFWMSAQETIEFDASPADDVTLRYGYWLYSDYDDNLAWFDVAESLLINQTLLEMAPIHKQDQLIQRATPIASTKLQTLKDAQTNAEFDGQDNSMIPYADDMDDWLQDGA
jgi:hypothetical protein